MSTKSSTRPRPAAIGTNPSTSPTTTSGKSAAPSTTTANAWSRPLQPKPAARPAGPPPGLRAPDGVRAAPNNGTNAQNVLRERFLHLTLSMVGHHVVVTQTDGSVIEGIFHTFTPFASQPPNMRNIYVIKACKSIREPSKPASSSNNTDGTNNGKRPGYASVVKDGCTVMIPAEKVSNLHIKSMPLDTNINNSNNNGGPSATWSNHDMFRTDTEISGGRGGREHGLVTAGSAWTSAESRAEALKGGGLEDPRSARRASSGGLKGSIGEWDQFHANEKLFDVKASFDENLYTTELDKSQLSADKKQHATRLAREIEGTVSTNVHLAEERGQKVEGDFDEEDLYSGVLRKAAPSKDAAAAKEAAKPAPAKAGPASQVPPSPKKMNYAAAVAKADAGKVAPSVVQPKVPATPAREEVKKTAEASAASKMAAPAKPAEPKEKEIEPRAQSQSNDKENKNEAQVQPLVEKPEVTSTGEKTGAEFKPVEAKKEAAESKPEEVAAESQTEQAKVEKTTDEPSEEAEKKKAGSKLNANAKEFTFNPGAKTFTPGGGGATGGAFGGQGPAEQQQQPLVDPATGMPAMGMPGAPQMPGQMHYMQHPGQMSQQGMMPMMNTHYAAAGMRYQGVPYPGMEQHMQPMQPMPPQPQHAPQQVQPLQPQQGHDSSANSVSSSHEGSQEVSQSDQQQPPQPQQTQQQQHQGMPMPYSMPPGGAGGYYGGQMAMRGPGGPHMGFPQMVGGPQQIPVMPGPYRQMYPGGPPAHMGQPGMPNMTHMRGPGGNYYQGPGGGMHYGGPGGYGHGPMDDDSGYRGGRGNGGRGGRGGGRRNSRRGGRGNGGRYYHHSQHYHNNNNNYGGGGQNNNGDDAQAGASASGGGETDARNDPPIKAVSPPQGAPQDPTNRPSSAPPKEETPKENPSKDAPVSD